MKLSFILFILLAIGWQAVSGDAVKIRKQDLHHRMTKRELQKYFGVNSKQEVPQYDVVAPVQADEKGEAVSSDLHNHRRKRDLHGSDVMFYKLNAFGAPLHLRMRRNTEFLGPNFHVEFRHVDGSRSFLKREVKEKHFIGHETSDENSMVALTSSKDGLTGMLNVADSSLFMHPLPAHLAKHYRDARGGRPHVLYKGSALPLNSDAKFEIPKRSGTKRDNISLEDDTVTLSDQPIRAQDVPDNDDASSIPNLEIIMIAANSTVDFHGKDYIPTYFAIMANIVHGMYKDKSIGHTPINVVLVKVVIVTNEELEIENSFSIKQKVMAVGRWFSANRDSLGTTADIAVFICKSASGGVASWSTVCSKGSANVCSDIGLQTVGVIAHETAHNIGIGHDGGSADCPNFKFIMSTTIPGGGSAHKWSNCSRNQFQNFFKTGMKCLANLPTQAEEPPAEYKKKKPGDIINGDEQCKLMYNDQYEHCRYLKSNCRTLYCARTSSTCDAKLAPPLEGTPCGERHWCIDGQCVEDGKPRVDGQWGAWGEFSPCSKTCGGGVRFRMRNCSEPQNGGEDCIGSSKGQYEICNAQDCPADSKSDRWQQCQEASTGSTEEYKGGVCELYCDGTKYGVVKDGTRCYSDSKRKDVCIQGVCEAVSCDNKLESTAIVDRCGACNGLGNTCPAKGDVMFVAPAGARRIFVQKSETGTQNAIGVKRPDQPQGERLIYLPSWSRTITYAGSRIIYYHEDYGDREYVKVPGPTTEPLAFEFVYLSGDNTGVDYSYIIPVSTPEPTTGIEFKWQVKSDWTQCSRTCAGGKSTRQVSCHRMDDQSIVGDEACTDYKPDSEKDCNTQPCPAEWYLTPWTLCSKSCATGKQTRDQKCRNLVSENTFKDVNVSLCKDPKPEATLVQKCNDEDCPVEYKPLEWGECSTTCGKGTVTRKLQCQQTTKDGKTLILGDFSCRHIPQLITKQPCNIDNPCEPPEKFSVGCYNDDGEEPHPMPEVLADLSQMPDDDPMAITKKCNSLATEKGYTFFAIRGGSECVSGPKAGETFFIDSTDQAENRCADGRSNGIAVYTTVPMPAYESKGCYNDESDPRALGTYLANMRAQIIWTSMKATVRQCARLAAARNFKYFAVQFYGECWASNEENYQVYGKSDNCYDGTGGEWTNFVYQFLQ